MEQPYSTCFGISKTLKNPINKSFKPNEFKFGKDNPHIQNKLCSKNGLIPHSNNSFIAYSSQKNVFWLISQNHFLMILEALVHQISITISPTKLILVLF